MSSDKYPYRVTGVIVHIDLLQGIRSGKKPAYLLKSKTMKRRPVEAKNHTVGITFDEASKELGA